MTARREALQRAIGKVLADDFANGLDALRPLIEDPSFEQLPLDERHGAMVAASQAALKLGRAAEAHAYVLKSTAWPEAVPWEWHLRLHAAWKLGDQADAVRAVTAIARRWPDTLDRVNPLAIVQLARSAATMKGADGLRRELLDALLQAPWEPAAIEVSWMWRDLALMLAEADLPRARAVARIVRSPREVVAMRVDRRFDPILAPDRDAFDVDRVIARNLDAIRATAEASPRSLRAVILHSFSLRAAARFDAALALTDDVLRRLGETPPPYDDLERELSWILHERAMSLQGLGRWDEAVDVQRRASQLPEQGRRNVNQAINLAGLYCELGRAQDALDAVAAVTDTNAYGEMQLLHARFLAALELGDATSATRVLAYLREHQADAVDTYQLALVQAGHLDEAADLLLKRLRDPELRNEALLSVQGYLEPRETPRVGRWRARWKEVLARPDVKATIDEVGHLERFPLVDPFL